SRVVDSRRGRVRPSAWGGPAEHARLCLLEPPPGGLLQLMVPAAWRAEIALVGWPRWPGRGVVQVAVDRPRAAAGGRAGRIAGADEVLEPVTRNVPVLAFRMIALALGNRGKRDAKARQQAGDLRCLLSGGRCRRWVARWAGRAASRAGNGWRAGGAG